MKNAMIIIGAILVGAFISNLISSDSGRVVRQQRGTAPSSDTAQAVRIKMQSYAFLTPATGLRMCRLNEGQGYAPRLASDFWPVADMYVSNSACVDRMSWLRQFPEQLPLIRCIESHLGSSGYMRIEAAMNKCARWGRDG